MKQVLFYNHADADESFVTMLTDEEIAQAKKEETSVSQELYDVAKSRRVPMPAICYYS
jgi:hypothetical protein